jgi:hypothetical protein
MVGFIRLIIKGCKLCATQDRPILRIMVYRFYYEVFAESLSELNKNFVPESDEGHKAVAKLLSCQVAVSL